MARHHYICVHTLLSVACATLCAVQVKYEVWYNTTAIQYKWYANAGIDVLGSYADTESSTQAQFAKDSSLPLRAQRTIDDAIIAWRGDGAGRSTSGSGLDISLRPYPRLKDSRGLGQQLGAFSVFIALIFSFLMLIIRVVTEKERHVTGAMRSTGLSDSAYW